MNPLWGLLLALPLIAAYLVRARVQRRTVSSLTIFRVLQEQVEVKRRFAVPHGLLSLLLVLLALVALVGSLLEPVPPRDVVVLLDQSTSMLAGDRQEQAREHLEAVVESLGRRDRIGLVDHRGRILLPLTEDHGAALELPLEPGGEPVPGATALARALGDEVLLIGDGGFGDGELQHLLVGEAADNLGITAVAARRTDGLGGLEVQVQVLNATDEDAVVPLQIGPELEGLWVPAGQQTSKTVVVDGEELLIRLPGEDGAAYDDQVSVRVGELTQARVLLLTERPDGFLASALRVHPRVELFVADSAESGQGYDLVLLEGVEGPTDARTVAFGVPAAHFGLEGQAVKRPTLIRWAFDDPALRFVDLDDIKVLRGEQIQGGEPLLETEQGALAVRLGDDLIVGFALEDSDLALRLGFVNLIANLVDHAAPPMDPTLIEGTLSSQESRLMPVRLGPEPQLDTGWALWRLALAAALLLLLAEAALQLRRRRRRLPQVQEQRHAA